jgi:hypothetical protein
MSTLVAGPDDEVGVDTIAVVVGGAVVDDGVPITSTWLGIFRLLKLIVKLQSPVAALPPADRTSAIWNTFVDPVDVSPGDKVNESPVRVSPFARPVQLTVTVTF